MEFHRSNYIDTTTAFTVDAVNTGTVQYLIDKNLKLGFSTVGYTGATTTTIVASFTANKVISHIFLQNHNLKDFSVYYNGTTTNSLFSTTTNSATSTYISFNSVTTQSITLLIRDAITSGQEREIGELVVTERLYQFERNPSIEDFKYRLDRKQIRHVMPDGGVVLFNIRDKYKSDLKLEFFSQTSYNTLFDIFDNADPLYFLPEPTTTAWNGNGYPVVWSGDFDLRYAINVKSAGYNGKITLEEEPGA